MAANRFSEAPEWMRKRGHVCNARCFPIKEVTFFCFVCAEEIFKSQVVRHGNRYNREAKQWECWYLCRDCKTKWVEEHERAKQGVKAEGWILTEFGWKKQGHFGVPTDKTLRQRHAQGRFLR